MRTGVASAAAVLLIAALPVSAQAPGGPPLTAKASEALMGPVSTRLVLSADGDHLAIVAPKGSRTVVVVDGVEGPAFDEIPLNFSWSVSRGGPRSMLFSATGGHSAYVGRRGGDFIAVVDGKEAATLVTSAALQSGASAAPGWKFAFNHDGSRLAYAELDAPGSWVMVVDGVKSPVYRALDLTQTFLNGKRLVYTAQTADQQWHAVVDGKPSAGYDVIRELKLTPDGLHYAFLADRAGAGPRHSLAVVDGVESPLYFGTNELEQAPDGRVAYMAITLLGDASGRGGAGALIVGGLSLTALVNHYNASFYDHDRVGYRLGSASHQVAFSPDGKRFAIVQRNSPNPGVTVMVSGKPMGPTYQAADELSWSPDGGHLMYQGISPAGTFPVVDGQELTGYTWIKDFQWSPDGKRYAFQAAAPSGTVVLVVDGKEQPQTHGLVDGSIQWSPDGKHLAYGARPGMSVFQPMVDGVAKAYNLQDFSTRNNPRILFPIFSWSPDGNRLAYVGLTMDPMPKGGVVVDGTLFAGPTSGFEFPSWSPDSKHFATALWAGNAWTAMVDGKLGPKYEEMLVLSSEAFRFVDAHTLRFYGIKAGQIYRVTLDIP